MTADLNNPGFADRALLLSGRGVRQEPDADGRPAPPVSGRLIAWDGEGSDPETYFDRTKPGMWMIGPPCPVCGHEFIWTQGPGRPRLVCSPDCARTRDLHLRADLRIARDPEMHTPERKANQLAGIRYLRQLQRQDREDAQLRRDLRRAGLTGLQSHDTGYESHVVSLATRHNGTRRVPRVDTEEDGSPPRSFSDPVWDGGTTSVYWQRDIVWRLRRGDGSWEVTRWHDETIPPPDGYEPNGPIALQRDGVPGVQDRAPMQPWEPRPWPKPYRPPALLLDDLDAMARVGDGETLHDDPLGLSRSRSELAAIRGDGE